MFENILFPTDFSEASARAASCATEMAAKCGAKLHVLHVIDDPFINAPSTSQHFRDELHGQVEKRFEEFKANNPALANAEFVERNGSAFAEIIQYAREAEIGMIVMATHGRSAISHAILGSVAQNVLRLAPCPVLAVPDPQNADLLEQDS